MHLLWMFSSWTLVCQHVEPDCLQNHHLQGHPQQAQDTMMIMSDSQRRYRSAREASPTSIQHDIFKLLDSYKYEIRNIF